MGPNYSSPYFCTARISEGPPLFAAFCVQKNGVTHLPLASWLDARTGHDAMGRRCIVPTCLCYSVTLGQRFDVIASISQSENLGREDRGRTVLNGRHPILSYPYAPIVNSPQLCAGYVMHFMRVRCGIPRGGGGGGFNSLET